MSLSDGYTGCSIGKWGTPPLSNNERPSSNSAPGSNFVSDNCVYTCRGRLLRRHLAERPSCLPCPLLGCLNSLPLVPWPECCQDHTDADARERGSDWRRFLCCDSPVRWLVSCVVFKRANGKLGAADGEAPAQPSQGSKAAPQSQSIRCQINLTISWFNAFQPKLTCFIKFQRGKLKAKLEPVETRGKDVC